MFRSLSWEISHNIRTYVWLYNQWWTKLSSVKNLSYVLQNWKRFQSRELFFACFTQVKVKSEGQQSINRNTHVKVTKLNAKHMIILDKLHCALNKWYQILSALHENSSSCKSSLGVALGRLRVFSSWVLNFRPSFEALGRVVQSLIKANPGLARLLISGSGCSKPD